MPDLVKFRAYQKLFIAPHRDGVLGNRVSRSAYDDQQSELYTDLTPADDPALSQVSIKGSMAEGEAYLTMATAAGLHVVYDPNFLVAMIGARNEDGIMDDRSVAMINNNILPAWYGLGQCARRK